MEFLFPRWIGFALTIGILVAGPTWAQGIGGGNRNNTGSGLSFGGGGGFGAGSPGGGLGGGGLGQGGFGQTGLGGGLGQGGFGQIGMGQIGFGQATTGFIGRDSAEVTAMFDNMTRQGEQFMNRMQRANNSRGNNANINSQPTRQKVRVQLKVTFDYPAPTTSPMAAIETDFLGELLATLEVTNLTIQREGGEIVLGGIARDYWERKVAEKLIKQQPGVTSVTNRMTIAETIDAPTPQE